jgi:hypothetical protein
MKKVVFVLMCVFLAGSMTSFADTVVYYNDYNDPNLVGTGFDAWNWGDGACMHTAVYADYNDNIVVEHTGTIYNGSTSPVTTRFGSKWDITVAGNTSDDPADYTIELDLRNVQGNWDPHQIEVFVLTKTPSADLGYGLPTLDLNQADGWVHVTANLGDLTKVWWQGAGWTMTDPNWSIEVGGPPWPGPEVNPGEEWTQIFLMDNLKITMATSLKAWHPYPKKNATDAPPQKLTLTWWAGLYAASVNGHRLYFDDVMDNVTNRHGCDVNGVVTTDPCYGPLATLDLGKTYYWAVDEVNDPCVWPGDVWKFTTVPYYFLDSFESYADSVALRNVWNKGTTRAIVTLITDPNFVRNGSQSMQFRYSNGSSPYYSEAYADTATLPSGIGSNWSLLKLLTLDFKGLTGNDPNEQMYVTLTDGSSPAHTATVFYDGAGTDLAEESWHEWNILLSAFTGVDMSNVKRIAIGLGDKVSSPSWSSYLYFDDIRLYVPRCVPSKTLDSDIDNDCDADYNDLAFLVNNWLISNYNVTPANPTDSNLVGWWKLDEESGTVADDSSVSNNDGNVTSSAPMWIAGKVDGALQLNGTDDYVDLPIGSIINSLTNSTFATWVDFNSASTGGWQRIFDFGTGTDVYMFLTPRVGTVGALRFAITTGSSGSEQQVNASTALASGWHHVAVTIDADNNTLSLYVDGDFVNQNTAATLDPNDLGATTQNWLGRSQWDGDAYFSGSLDDFRIYNRALSQGEVAWLAGKTTEFAQPLYLLLTPTDPNIDLNDDGKINYKDYVVLANDWLKEQLWP